MNTTDFALHPPRKHSNWRLPRRCTLLACNRVKCGQIAPVVFREESFVQPLIQPAGFPALLATVAVRRGSGLVGGLQRDVDVPVLRLDEPVIRKPEEQGASANGSPGGNSKENFQRLSYRRPDGSSVAAFSVRQKTKRPRASCARAWFDEQPGCRMRQPGCEHHSYAGASSASSLASRLRATCSRRLMVPTGEAKRSLIWTSDSPRT